MKANELRIGNLVQNKSGEIVTISGDSLAEIDGFDDRLLIEPIPLTEEWLLKFGFTKDSVHLFYSLGQFIIRHDFVLCDIDIRVEIKYVHQLQNLYFALTGKELEIK